jgi:hypothetical protein
MPPPRPAQKTDANLRHTRLVTMRLDSEPIYETLKRHMLEQQALAEQAIAASKARLHSCESTYESITCTVMRN